MASAPRVEILSLNINNDQLIKKLADTKKSIDELQASQKQLTAAGQTSSTQFVQQAAQLKSLQSQYSTQMNVVTQLNNAKKDAKTVAEALNHALEEESASVHQATENNKILIAVRNQLDASTKEGAESIELLNAKINENTEFIKANVSAGEQQKMGIGSYTESIKEAFSAINPLNGGLAGFTQRSAEAGGAGNLLTQSFKGMTTGIYGMLKAGLAFLATPLGAAIGLLAVAVGVVVGAFKFMTASMNSTEAGSQKLAKVTATITGVFNGLWKLVKPLGEFMGNAFVKYFEFASAAVEKAVGIVSGGLRMLGFDKAADGVDKFAGAMKQGAKDAAGLAEAEAKLTKMEREAELTKLKYQKTAEKLRQVRDDESKSIKERAAANEQLGAVLKQQMDAELAIAKQALLVANLREQSEGKSEAVLNAQAEALTKIADIEERITGQESEQLTNRNALRKEAADKAKEIADKAAADRQAAVDKAIQQNKDEIDLYIAQQGIKKKAMAEELAFEEELSKKRLAVLQKEFEAGKMSKTAYEAQKLAISNEFAQKQVEATIANAQAELDQYKAGLEKKRGQDTFFNEQRLAEKLKENNSLLQKELEFQALRLQQGVINEQEYNQAINAANEANRVANEEAAKARDEAALEKKLVDLDNERAANEENFITQLEIEREQNALKMEQELALAEKNGADTQLIKDKYAAMEKQLDDSVTDYKISAYQQTASMIKGLFKENSVVGKAAAIADVAMTTYQNAAKAFAQAAVFASNPLTLPLAANAKVQGGLIIAQGAIQTAKIGGVKFAKGGILQGESHANGGIPFTIDGRPGFEAEGGETIINKRSSAMFLPLLSAINQAGGGYAFANGGSLGNTNLGHLGAIDYDVLALKIADANRSLPSPRVALTDIADGITSVKLVESGANH